MGCAFMLIFLLRSIAANSPISSASFGYFGCSISLAAIPLLICLVTPHYFHGILRVQLEACQVLNHEKDIEVAQCENGGRSRVVPTEASPDQAWEEEEEEMVVVAVLP